MRKAKLLVVAFDEPRSVAKLLRQIQHHTPGLPVCVSTKEDKDIETIAEARPSLILPENVAAGLAQGQRVLEAVGFEHSRAKHRVDEVRAVIDAQSLDH